MSVFAVVATDTSHDQKVKVSKLISQKFTGEYLELDKGTWLVSAKEIYQPKLIFDALFGNDMTTSCIIVPVEAYWGIQDPTVWNWIQQRMNHGRA